MLRTLREKKLALDIHYQDMERRLAGLPELVKQALDHAAQLQREADSLDESVCHVLVSVFTDKSDCLSVSLSLYLCAVQCDSVMPNITGG